MWSQVHNQVGRQVRDKVESQVSDQVSRQGLSQVRSQLRDHMGDLVYYEFSSCGNFSDYGWLSFYDFFEEIGVVGHDDFVRYRDLMGLGIFDMVQLDGLCVVSVVPCNIFRDREGRLHNDEGGFAVSWGDGYGQYYISGVYFDEGLYGEVLGGGMGLKEVMGIGNIEQRMVAVKYMDSDRLLSESKALRIVTGKPSSKYTPLI